MNPDAVMDDAMKKVRFRKFLKKQNDPEKRASSSGSSGGILKFGRHQKKKSSSSPAAAIPPQMTMEQQSYSTSDWNLGIYQSPAFRWESTQAIQRGFQTNFGSTSTVDFSERFSAGNPFQSRQSPNERFWGSEPSTSYTSPTLSHQTRHQSSTNDVKRRYHSHQFQTEDEKPTSSSHWRSMVQNPMLNWHTPTQYDPSQISPQPEDKDQLLQQHTTTDDSSQTSPDQKVATPLSVISSNSSAESRNVPKREIIPSPYVLQEDIENSNFTTHSYDTRDIKVRKRMTKYIQHLDTIWDLSKSALQVDANFIQNLKNFHLGYEPLNKTLFKYHLTTIAKLYINFAKQEQEFAHLKNIDQRRLITRNAPLFIQFILAKYFTQDVPGQTEWLLQNSCCPTQRSITFGQFCDKAGMFKGNGSLLDKYEKRVKKCGTFTCRPALVALASLYQTDEEDILEEEHLISEHLQNALTIISWSHEVYGTPSWKEMSVVLRSLQGMSNLFDKMVKWDSYHVDLNPIKREVVLSFTNEKNFWKENAIENFNNGALSVPLGKTIIMTMWSKCQSSDGSNKKKDFASLAVDIFKNRAIYVSLLWLSHGLMLLS